MKSSTPETPPNKPPQAQHFIMVYQPIMNLTTGQLTYAEALIRKSDQETLTPASQFITAIKNAGHLSLLGLIMRNLVSNDLAHLDAHPHTTNLPIAVNISPEELQHPEYHNQISQWVVPGGLNRIILEVTETTPIHPEGVAIKTLTHLRIKGATIAVDDFGTGYSNLERVQQLQPDIIKIDRSLLIAATTNTQSFAVLVAAIELGHTVKAQVIVEGIETNTQAKLATTLGAHLGQGYLYAYPMPVNIFTAWAAQHHIKLAAYV